MRTRTQKIVFTSLLTALACVTTMAVKIPTPLGGYVNLGDAIVFMAAALLSPLYAVFAAGVGSALADLFSGYVIYAPATFVIKGGMAALLLVLHKAIPKKLKALSFFLAACCVPIGYFLFESCLYGIPSAAPNLIFNFLQGQVGAIAALLLSHTIRYMERGERHHE